MNPDLGWEPAKIHNIWKSQTQGLRGGTPGGWGRRHKDTREPPGLMLSGVSKQESGMTAGPRQEEGGKAGPVSPRPPHP